MNQVFLMGLVGKDPEVKTIGQKGTFVATFSVATSKKRGDDYETTWHNIKAWGKTAEYVRDRVRKGDEVFVDGENTVESWADKKTNLKVYRSLVTAFVVRVTREGSTSAQPNAQSGGDPGPEEVW